MSVESARTVAALSAANLDAVIEQFNQWKNSSLVPQVLENPEYWYRIMGLRIVSSPRNETFAELGVWLGSLRSALDQLATAAHERWPAAAGVKVGKVYFPIPQNSTDEIERTWKWFASVPSDKRDLFLGAQNLSGGDTAFRRFAQLSNTRHREFHVVTASSVGIGWTAVELPPPGIVRGQSIAAPGALPEAGQIANMAEVWYANEDNREVELPRTVSVPALPEITLSFEIGVADGAVRMTFSEMQSVAARTIEMIDAFAALPSP